jgi:hypothetical protein
LGLNIEVNDDGPSWIGRPVAFLCRRGFEAIIGQAAPFRPARPVSDEKPRTRETLLVTSTAPLALWNAIAGAI